MIVNLASNTHDKNSRVSYLKYDPYMNEISKSFNVPRYTNKLVKEAKLKNSLLENDSIKSIKETRSRLYHRLQEKNKVKVETSRIFDKSNKDTIDSSKNINNIKISARLKSKSKDSKKIPSRHVVGGL